MSERALPSIGWTPNGFRASGASVTLLTDLLIELEFVIREAGVSVDQLLAPGVEAEYVESRLNSIGLYAPSELKVWFAWHNGRREGVTGQPLPSFIPLSLESAIARHRLDDADYRKMNGWSALSGGNTTAQVDLKDELVDAENYFGMGPYWLSLSANIWGTAIQCSADYFPPRLRSPQLEFDTRQNPTDACAVSLCTIVTWWLEGIRDGAWNWNPSSNGWDCIPEWLPASQQECGFNI